MNSFVGNIDNRTNEKIFKDLKCFVIGTVKFKKNWSNLIEMSGSLIVETVDDLSNPEFDFVLSERVVAKKIFTKISEKNIKIVNMEWVIHCLIHQTVLGFDDELYQVY